MHGNFFCCCCAFVDNNAAHVNGVALRGARIKQWHEVMLKDNQYGHDRKNFSHMLQRFLIDKRTNGNTDTHTHTHCVRSAMIVEMRIIIDTAHIVRHRGKAQRQTVIPSTLPAKQSLAKSEMKHDGWNILADE